MSSSNGKNRIPELLAPVGGWEQLKAAVNNGADAVYMGGSLFNARMKADNFGGEELKKAITYCHQRNVKVYITLNTLIKEREMAKAFDYACTVFESGADGIILQDLGLARLIRKYIPEMEMHLSTQGTVYNSQALETVKELGFNRVVPGRELNIDEIGVLCKKGKLLGLEVEVFVHGALCMCYSGQCQMSRLLGGGKGAARSGNRGLCAQPCRLMYRTADRKSSYALSPKDICTVEDIPVLCSKGVDSLKIEGRLKGPEYVAAVTSIYRKYLDIYERAGEVCLEDEDRRRLLQIFNRGGFTKGYLYENTGKKILSGSSPKNRGLYVGKVKGVMPCKGKAAKEGKYLVDAQLIEPVKMGDGIELEKTGNVVTYVQDVGKGLTRLGDFKPSIGDSIKPGEAVYKVTDKALNEELERTYKGLPGQESDRVMTRKTPVSFSLKAIKGQEPVLIAELQDENISVRAMGEDIICKAINKPADRRRIESQLAKLGGTPFTVISEEIQLDVEDDAMIPISVINDLRRQAVSMLMEARCEKTANSYVERKEEGLEEAASFEAMPEGFDRDVRLIPLEKFMTGDFSEEKFIPYVINITKGKTDRYIEENFEEICQAVRNSGIALGNLGWIKAFRDRGITVYGDYGLNIYNSQAVLAMEEIGVRPAVWSNEMSDDGFHRYMGRWARGIAREPGIMNRAPLMITEHPLSSDHLVDRKGVMHEVMKWYSDDKYLIF